MRRMIAVLVLAVPSFVCAQSNDEQAGRAAYQKKDWTTCAALYTRAGDSYNAACCYALGGDKEHAFAALRDSMQKGWQNTKHLQADTDLATLHDDPRWKDIVAQSDANRDKARANDNHELWSIVEADQADRQDNSFFGNKEAIERDKKRLARTKEIIAAGALKTSADYFNAALVLQHSSESADYLKAHELAQKSAELDPNNRSAKWLSAAAQDRYLLSIGKPQIYGTQYRMMNNVWELSPIDESAVTDEERAKLNVPPLAESKRRVADMNKKQ